MKQNYNFALGSKSGGNPGRPYKVMDPNGKSPSMSIRFFEEKKESKERKRFWGI